MWLGKLTKLDMTPFVDWAVKAQHRLLVILDLMKEKKIRCLCPQKMQASLHILIMTVSFRQYIVQYPIIIPRHTKYAKGVYSFCLFCVCVCLWVNIYFVSKISQELLYLES